MIVYKITNLKNHKIYIGKTIKTIDSRFKEHIKSSKNKNSRFYSAIRKYGIKSFEKEILWSSESNNIKLLNDMERFYIAYFNSMDPICGYNMTPGADGGNPESFRRYGKSLKNKSWIERYGENRALKLKENLVIHLKSRIRNPHSSRTKIKISKTLKDKHKNDEKFRSKYLDNMATFRHLQVGTNAPNYGNKHSEETRAKISNHFKGKTRIELMGKERAKKLKEFQQSLVGPLSSRYKEIDANLILNELIKDPYINLSVLCLKFNMSRPTLSKRIKEIIGESNLQKLRHDFSKDEIIDFLHHLLQEK